MAKSTRSRSPSKAKKPHPDFPLWPHPSGRWCKKVRGRFCYFGRIADDPKGETALTLWLEQKDDLLAGRTPGPKGSVSLADIVNAYLADADRRRGAGELSAVSFRDYCWIGKKIVGHFGRTVDPEQLRPTDFAEFRHKLAEEYAPGRLAKTVTVTRTIIRWAYESELVAALPRFGPGFKATSKRAARLAKTKRNTKLFAPHEIRLMIEKARPAMKAMILLGINGGMGNTDVASLPLSAIDLRAEMVSFPRPKTGVDRRFPLWSETVIGLREALEVRPTPASPEFEDLAFLTVHRNPWVLVKLDGTRTDSVVLEFRKLLKKCGLYRPRAGFYWLRHTFQTIADEARDPIATAHVMGHADGTIGGVYRERISDERLRAVTDYVRAWLFDEVDTQPAEPPQLRVVG